jgi:hypothetical protein
MPQYDVYALCNYCGTMHPMGIGIYLDDGPADKQSIENFYQGKSWPPQVQALRFHKTLCLKTGKTFTQEDDNQIFLVPASSVVPQRRP